MKRAVLLLAFILSVVLLNGKVAYAQSLDLVGQFTGTDESSRAVNEGTEVISVQASTARAALTNSQTGTISILDLSEPTAPTLAGLFDLGLGPDDGITSVAFHPTDDYFIVAILTRGAETGRAEIRSASTGAVLNTLTTGSEPDAVAIDKQGRRAIVSNEGESFLFDAGTGTFSSPEGSVTIIDLRHGPAVATAMTVALPDATGTPGMVEAGHNRFFERGVDLDGDGDVADEFEDGEGGFDEDLNGVIEDRDFLAGYIIFIYPIYLL